MRSHAFRKPDARMRCRSWHWKGFFSGIGAERRSQKLSEFRKRPPDADRASIGRRSDGLRELVDVASGHDAVTAAAAVAG
jgi:hypothetical protein